MLQVEKSQKASFVRKISDGDVVIVYERHDTMKAVKVSDGGELQNRFGVFKHSDWIGKPFGSKVFSSTGRFVFLLAPSPELWTLVLSHRTQILYLPDISLVVSCLEVVPGCTVLESGTGSGSLTTSLARAVATAGHVFTFDFHEQRASSAREDFQRNNLSSLVTVAVRDVQGEGFPAELKGMADAVFLDLPQPWLAVPSAAEMLKPDATFCSFSPCIEQVQRTCESLKPNFTDVRTFEILLRTYEIKEADLLEIKEGHATGPLPRKRRHCSPTTGGGLTSGDEAAASVIARPCGATRGHTGYLTFARLRVAVGKA